MANALSTGVAGLSSHQQMLDVIGNNLANLNTTGFKTRRILFSDLLYETVRSGAGAGAGGTIGSVNPAQIGSGSSVSQVNAQFAQGNLENTGEALDFALEGPGFFVVNDGAQDLYTRAGAFAVDESGTLVDPATGYRVQRQGTIGEPNGIDPGFQVAGDSSIHIPLGAVIPGRATTSIDVSGNLPVSATGPQAQRVESFNPWTSGGSAASGATTLNSLDQNTAAYVAGDSIVISGADHDGTAVSSTFAVDGATTLADLVAAVDAAFAGATAVLESDGRISLTSTATGASQLSLSLSDGSGNAGGTDFIANPSLVSTTGKVGDTFAGMMEVFDSRGGAHPVTLTYEKQADGTWNIDAALSPGDGTVIDGSVESIRFNDDGSFLQVDGTGTGDPAFTFLFPTSSTPQTMTLNFGTRDSFDGLVELPEEVSLLAAQDGFSAGTFVSVQVGGDGLLQGIATNGQSFPLAQLAIAGFSNPDGLLAIGNNYFDNSLASGDPRIGPAASGGRGAVRGGQLEGSNVDIALEFTRLIVAQRGFSANARTITVTDEVLEELTNLIR